MVTSSKCSRKTDRVSEERKGILKCVLTLVAAVYTALALPLVATAKHAPTMRDYGRALAAKYGWTGQEWKDLDAIVTAESGWDSCAVNPSTHDCSYAGSNSCGIPQRDPCPSAWRGDLWGMRWDQLRNLMIYIKSRYGNPVNAYAFRLVHHWY